MQIFAQLHTTNGQLFYGEWFVFYSNIGSQRGPKKSCFSQKALGARLRLFITQAHNSARCYAHYSTLHNLMV